MRKLWLLPVAPGLDCCDGGSHMYRPIDHPSYPARAPQGQSRPSGLRFHGAWSMEHGVWTFSLGPTAATGCLAPASLAPASRRLEWATDPGSVEKLARWERDGWYFRRQLAMGSSEYVWVRVSWNVLRDPAHKTKTLRSRSVFRGLGETNNCNCREKVRRCARRPTGQFREGERKRARHADALL